MNCPGHMLLFGSQLRSYRDLRSATPSPRRCTATSSPAPSTGCCASATSRKTTRTSSARWSSCRRRSTPCIEFAKRPVCAVRSDSARGAVHPARQQAGSDEDRDFTEDVLRSASTGTRLEYVISVGRARSTGRRSTSSWTTAGSRVADGTIQLDRADACALRAHLHGPRQRRAHAVRRAPRAARLTRALHRHHHRALRRRIPLSGSPRSRCVSCPSATISTMPPGAGREMFAGGFRSDVDDRAETWQADPRRRAREGAVRRRLGGSRVRTPSSPCGSAGRGSRRCPHGAPRRVRRACRPCARVVDRCRGSRPRSGRLQKLRAPGSAPPDRLLALCAGSGFMRGRSSYRSRRLQGVSARRIRSADRGWPRTGLATPPRSAPAGAWKPAPHLRSRQSAT